MQLFELYQAHWCDFMPRSSVFVSDTVRNMFDTDTLPESLHPWNIGTKCTCFERSCKVYSDAERNSGSLKRAAQCIMILFVLSIPLHDTASRPEGMWRGEFVPVFRSLLSKRNTDS